MAEILLACPRGFCAGVDRAIAVVERALSLFGRPVYVRHEVVHNRFVVADLRARGVVFVEDLVDVPADAVLIFSAHGVSEKVVAQAHARHLRVFDATCPLVTKVHLEVAAYARRGFDVLLIGHAGHPEVEGTMGRYRRHNEGSISLVQNLDEAESVRVRDPNRLGCVSQTTLSLDDTAAIRAVLQRRFSAMELPPKEDICYATQNRQDAVKILARQVEVILVVGSPNSSNSNRLCEMAIRHGCPAYLLDDARAIEAAWLHGKTRIGVTAGASAPEILVQQVVAALQGRYPKARVAQLAGQTENIAFSLPAALRS